jgi:hypothetical protein
MAPHTVDRYSVDEAVIDAKHLDIDTVREGASRARATHYEPKTDEERALDKRVNRKLDWIVLSLLALEFIVSDTNVILANITRIALLTVVSSVVLTRPTSASSQPAHL